MMGIREILQAASAMEGAVLEPPAGLPVLREGEVLPADLRKLYSLCGGLTLPVGPHDMVRILSPVEVIPSNPVIAYDDGEGDRSYHWYLLAIDENGDHIVWDTHPNRVGRCYEGYFDCYAVVGSMRVLATSVTDFLGGLVFQSGEEYYWDADEFILLGDAYD